MQCKDVDLALEQDGLTALPEAARAHLSTCSGCRQLVEDLSGIVTAAKQLPGEAEPPAHIWVSLRKQLEQEGLIREAAASDEQTRPSAIPWWAPFAEFLRGRVLATVAVTAIAVLAVSMQFHKAGAPALAPEPRDDSFSSAATVLDQQEHDLANMQLAGTSPSSSEVDASLQQNLRDLDLFIADCERRVKEEPRDTLAREYLSGAYQQKAELLSAMMDRGRSLN